VTCGKAEKKGNLHITEALEPYLGKPVVLDTSGSIVYVGTLREVLEVGFWLDHADIHDCSEGHANKEVYIYESQRDGIRTNRSRVFVMRPVVISISLLTDVVMEDLEEKH